MSAGRSPRRPRPSRAPVLRGAVLGGLVLGALVVVAACGSDPGAAAPWFTDRLGGDTTARALRGRPLNQSARNLGFAELGRFSAGADVFDHRFGSAEGLGPDFDDTGCLGCHIDGTEATGEVTDVPPGLLVRIGSTGGTPPFGSQLRTRSVTGPPEAEIDVAWETVPGRYDDGTPYELRRPAFAVRARTPLPPGTPMSFRMATPIVGLGLLEAIPESDLWAAADPDDADGDGISGRVAVVADPDDPNWQRVARFGWKATQVSVESQTRAALENDIGITTTGDGDRPAEIDDEDLADLVFYNRTIAVPISRLEDDAAAARGAVHITELGCASCHTPTQRSGTDSEPALADQTFHPFTDLLLHDLGEGLDDGRPDGAAAGREWRTPPLWGLGRRVEVTERRSFLHDGRARTPTEAVLWHGGEAAAARRRFMALPAADRADLAAFLDGL